MVFLFCAAKSVSAENSEIINFDVWGNCVGSTYDGGGGCNNCYPYFSGYLLIVLFSKLRQAANNAGVIFRVCPDHFSYFVVHLFARRYQACR
jgi:hypothetical protein